MMGRLLAVCGWLAWHVGRPFRRGGLRAYGRQIAMGIAALLAVLAAVPLILPQFGAQPTDAGVQEIFDGVVTEPGSWVRLRGRVFPLTDSPTGQGGNYALLVDEVDTLRAIVLRAPTAFPDTPPEEIEPTAVTGRLVALGTSVEEELPIQATVAGTPPRVMSDRVLELDPVTTAERAVWWPLAIPPALLAIVLGIGARVGYPIFRPSSVIDVLAAPLGPGERLPAAYGGQVGPNHCDLADPGAALLLVRRGPRGNLLTAQPLADEGALAPAPVTIGGSWTAGRIGDVFTVSETIPALVVRSELVNATFLFARTAERDRVAALVAVER
ncbi:MAG TPA: hypothetical protein VF365_02050 [Candidatus Limnocylindria bacterium]